MSQVRRRRRFAAAGALAAGVVATVAAFSAGPAPSRHGHRIARSHPTRNASAVAYVAHPPSHPRTIVVTRRASKHVHPHRRKSAAPVALEKTPAPTAPNSVPAEATSSPVPATPSFDPRFYGK